MDLDDEQRVKLALSRAFSFLNKGDVESAFEVLQILLLLVPGHEMALTKFASCLSNLGKHEEALKILAKQLARNPNNIDAKAMMARTLFWMENWEEAWKAFSVRFALMDTPPACFGRTAEGQRYVIPPWRGEGAPEHVAVICEQGLGDSIHFIRYLLPLAERGIKISLVAPQKLEALFRSLEIEFDFYPLEGSDRQLETRCWVALLDLPHVLGLPVEAYGAAKPYLSADAKRQKTWAKKLKGPDFKIGLVWAGNPENTNNASRSVPLSAFEPLSHIPDVKLYSLQIDESRKDIETVDFVVHELGDDFDAGADAFLDSAAVMEELDLIISIDTSLAHLAGALGRPLWLLLSAYDHDWRWLRDRQETLWYPTARLYRKDPKGDWDALLAKMAGDLQSLVHEKCGTVSKEALPSVPMSVGELVDKMTILALKAERISEKTKLASIKKEHGYLENIWQDLQQDDGAINDLVVQLRDVNEALWDIEERIRQKEEHASFDDEFIDLARSVYQNNDKRAALKSEINDLAGSVLREEKSYKTG